MDSILAPEGTSATPLMRLKIAPRESRSGAPAQIVSPMDRADTRRVAARPIPALGRQHMTLTYLTT